MVDASLKTSLGGVMAFEISDERVDVIAYFALTHICFAHIKAVEKCQGQRHVHLSKASVQISWYLLMDPFNIGMGHLKNI
jgi:hypothetical protein